MADRFTPTARSEVRRVAKRAAYDRQTIESILDEGVVCHVGFVVDRQPFVIPTGYARVGDRLYIHGSTASRMMRSLQQDVEVSVTVTLVDGFVLARSAFHHSLNYRSVVVFGKARLVVDPAEQLAALRAFTNHLVPGRWSEVRAPNEQELKATAVLALSITEASAKVRQGPPLDDEADYSLPVWAGVVPVRMAVGQPVADDRVLDGVSPFDAQRLERGRAV